MRVKKEKKKKKHMGESVCACAHVRVCVFNQGVTMCPLPK